MWLVLSCWHPISIGSCIEPWNSLNEPQECIFEWRVRGSHIHGVTQKLQRQETQKIMFANSRKPYMAWSKPKRFRMKR
jgi:hypothetical protein